MRVIKGIFTVLGFVLLGVALGACFYLFNNGGLEKVRDYISAQNNSSTANTVINEDGTKSSSGVTYQNSDLDIQISLPSNYFVETVNNISLDKGVSQLKLYKADKGSIEAAGADIYVVSTSSIAIIKRTSNVALSGFQKTILGNNSLSGSTSSVKSIQNTASTSGLYQDKFGDEYTYDTKIVGDKTVIYVRANSDSALKQIIDSMSKLNLSTINDSSSQSSRVDESSTTNNLHSVLLSPNTLNSYE